MDTLFFDYIGDGMWGVSRELSPCGRRLGKAKLSVSTSPRRVLDVLKRRYVSFYKRDFKLVLSEVAIAAIALDPWAKNSWADELTMYKYIEARLLKCPVPPDEE